MVLASGHGMGDVASHPLNRSDGAKDPGVARVLGNIYWGISSTRNRVGSERRGDHGLGIGRLDSQERFTVLIGLSAEACRNQIYNLDVGRCRPSLHPWRGLPPRE